MAAVETGVRGGVGVGVIGGGGVGVGSGGGVAVGCGVDVGKGVDVGAAVGVGCGSGAEEHAASSVMDRAMDKAVMSIRIGISYNGNGGICSWGWESVSARAVWRVCAIGCPTARV